MKITVVLALLSANLAPAVQGAAVAIECNEVPCLDYSTETCEDLVLHFNFNDDGCCFSLADSNNGGCAITVEGKSTGDICGRVERIESRCGLQEIEDDGATALFPSCLYGALYTYFGFDTLNTTPECPPSEYAIEKSSQFEHLFYLNMTLAGVSSWTEQDTSDWIAVTVNHTLSYFEANPDLGYSDILSSIPQVWGNDGLAIIANGTGTLLYYQTISWRTDLVNTTTNQVMEAAFNSCEGSQSYLEMLQASSNPTLAAVTATSGYRHGLTNGCDSTNDSTSGSLSSIWSSLSLMIAPAVLAMISVGW